MGAEPVQGTAAGNHHEPGGPGAAPGVESACGTPGLPEGVLHDIFGLIGILEDPERDRMDPLGPLVVQSGHRRFVPIGHATEEDAILVFMHACLA